MKKSILIIMLVFSLILLTGCVSASNDTTNQQDETIQTENADVETTQPEEVEVVDRYADLKVFISTYNGIAAIPITAPVEIDIQSDEYYQTEFRLMAFDDAPAYEATIGNNTIIIINKNYDGFKPGVRIYADIDTIEATTDLFESFCKSTDSDITKEDFDEFYEFYSLDSGNCNVVIESVSGFVTGTSSTGFEVMLDATPDYFD
jgi:hypothetical protein